MSLSAKKNDTIKNTMDDDQSKQNKPQRTVNWLMMMVLLSFVIGVIAFYLYISGRGARGPRGRFVRLSDVPMKSL